MTDIRKEKVKCAACGYEQDCYYVLGEYITARPFLDGHINTGNEEYYLQECPKCGYISYDIAEINDISKDWLDINVNLNLPIHTNILSEKYYKLYSIYNYKHDYSNAFDAIRSAYWHSGYKKYLDISLSLIGYAYKDIYYKEDRICLDIQYIDFLRKAKRFDEAIEMINESIVKDEDYKYIFEYEKYLCNKKDSEDKKIEQAKLYKRHGKDELLSIDDFKSLDDLKNEIREILLEYGLYKDHIDDALVMMKTLDEYKELYKKIQHLNPEYIDGRYLESTVIGIIKNFNLMPFLEQDFNNIFVTNCKRYAEESLKIEIPNSLSAIYGSLSTGTLYDVDDSTIDDPDNKRLKWFIKTFNELKSITSDNRKIRLWMSFDNDDMCFLSWLCYLMPYKEMYVPNYNIKKDKDKFKFDTLNSLPYKFFNLEFRKLTTEEKTKLGNYWPILVKTNKEYRTYYNGEFKCFNYDEIVRMIINTFDDNPIDMYDWIEKYNIDETVALDYIELKEIFEKMISEGLIKEERVKCPETGMYEEVYTRCHKQ